MLTIRAIVHARVELTTHPNEKMVYFQIAPDNAFGIRMATASAEQFRPGDMVMLSIQPERVGFR